MNRSGSNPTIEKLIREFAAEGEAASLTSLLGTLNRRDIPASEAIGQTDRVLETFRQLGTIGTEDGRDLQLLGAIAQTYEFHGGLEKAYGLYGECLEAGRRSGDDASVADTLWKMGRVERKRNRWERALEHLNESADLHAAAGNTLGLARCRIAQGNVYWERGDLDAAAAAFGDALDAGEQNDDRSIVADASNNLGILATIRGDFDQAEVRFASATSNYEQLDNRRALARVHHNLGMGHLARRSWDAALDAFETSLEVSLDTGNLRLAGSTFVQKAAVYVELGDAEVATRYCARALDIFQEVDYPLGQAEVLKLLGRISTIRENWATAEGLLQESLRICTDYGSSLGAAEARRELGLLSRARGRGQEAQRLLEEALSGFEALGAQHDAHRTQDLLST